MKRKKVVAFTIADKKNEPYLQMMKNSLRKFHSEEELPLVEITGQLLQDTLAKDPNFFYRATPSTAHNLVKNYDVIVKIDADSVIVAPINEAWEGDFDIKLVLNSNPREFRRYPVTLLDIDPVHEYVNAGFVSMQSERFITHWHRLCYSNHFENYQYKEQDLLNIIVHYGDYNAQLLENSDQFWGLSSKGFWADIELRKDKLVLPTNDEWNKNDRWIKVIHWAGGNEPSKMNFNIKFKPEVAKWLNNLTKDETSK